MPLIKLATAARRARMGSTNTMRRALIAAGVPLVTLSPGEYVVEEADLNRFLQTRHETPPAAPPKPKARPAADPTSPATPESKPKGRKRRS